MPTFDPLAPIYVPPIVPQSEIDRSPKPVSSAQDPGVPKTTATVVPASARKTTPPPVVPGVATGTSVTSTNSVPSLDIATAAANVTPAASATGNVIIPTMTKPGGNTGAIQFNNNSTFGGSANLFFAQNGLWVGGVSTSADASGIITAKNDFRAGSWKPVRFGAETDTFSRFRHVTNAPNANTTFYGFNSDYQVAQQQPTVITNETQLTSAAVLFEGVAYNTSAARKSPATIFGVSVNNGYASDRPSTGTEFGWKKLMEVTNWGDLGIGGNITINPSWQYIATQPANNQVGITFADGTFQYTAATGGTITIRDEGSNVVTGANTINFVGSGVTASNVSGVATITIPGGGTSGIAVQEEGTNVVATTTTVNFVGAGATASNVGGVATITIPGGISGINMLYNTSVVTANATTINFSGPLANVTNVGFGNATDIGIGLTVRDEGTVVTGNAAIGTLNFLGAGVTVTAGSTGVANITIPGGSSGDTVYNLGSISGTTVVDVSNGTIQTCTLTGNVFFNLSSVTSAKSVTLLMTQGTGGNKFATYDGTVLFAAGYKTLSTAAGAVDMLNIVNIGGTYYATLTVGYTT
jgi:hypothetical protein